ncbi:hypothetical protein J5N97_026086 [Dioscorea zingiberensis]|uniref:Retrotransposon gag domain-containing protein n=1 Tax=Dioscorea zingiberensis TaxID=325984 RepID=A0A9D5C2R0_9LILI|nr:hypothetical protein J5N97_026086 [Dioscorea zingiberensis]
MKLTPGELSGSSSPPPTTTRRRHHLPPSPSTTSQQDESQPEEEEDQYSLSNSYSKHHQHHHKYQNDYKEEEEYYDDNDEDNIEPYYSSNFSGSAPPTYINVAPLPIFHGSDEECAVAHLSRFERVCRANNATTLDMITRIFPVTLNGEAALWYELTIEPNPSMSWNDIKSLFLEAYRPPESFDEFRAELMEIRQGETESVNGYRLRMQWMLKKWPEHEMPEKVLKGIFVDGLREEFREWVAVRQPETVEEAVRFAMVWERARRRRRDSELKCGFCDGLHEETCCEVKRRMKELWLRSRDGLPEGRMIAPAGSMVRRDTVGEERGVSLRRSECKCWKHQCWKRSNSMVTDVNANDDANPE